MTRPWSGASGTPVGTRESGLDQSAGGVRCDGERALRHASDRAAWKLGTGKSTTARLARAGLRDGPVDVQRGHYRNNVALIEQDYVRRILLGEYDHPDGINIRLIDQTARLALDGGFDVIIEGMLFADRYAEMLTAITRDHHGVTHHWYFDASLDVTQQRHLHRAESAHVPVSKLAEWYREDDLLPGVVQRIMKSAWTPPEAAAEIIGAARTGPGREPNGRTVR